MPIIKTDLEDSSLRLLDELQKRIHTANRSDTIARALALTDAITKALKDGASVIIEEKNGQKIKIDI